MVQVSGKKLRAFVDRARSTPDPDKNFSGKPQVPQSKTITNSKADERNLEKEPTPAEEDARLMDKFGTDWQDVDRLERTVQDMSNAEDDKERGPSSGFSDKSRRRYTLNLSKLRKK